MPSGSKDLYQTLVEKVSEIFSLPMSGFRLFWQDMDGDFVTFSSTVELMEAVRFSPEDVLRLYVRPACTGTTQNENGAQPTSHGTPGASKDEEKVFHPGVVCDGCEQPIYGPRYKCVICPDYDLCFICEQKGIHPEHDKFKITHPRTAGGPGGFMPPHFRRWMHRFMKRCHGGQCPAGGAGGQADPLASQSQGNNTDSTAQQDELLKDVGENIRAFLDPFGIDVSYEVRHDDPRWTWGMFGQGGCVPPKAEKPAEKDEEKSAEAAPSEGQDIPVVMEDVPREAPLHDEASKRETSPARCGDEDWTMVHDGETADGSMPTSLYPNLKVAQSVEMMKAMGFADEGGCLTRLLTATDGDIAKALDTLKIGAQQASRLT